MPAKRAPAVQKRAYVEIDASALTETGEVKIVGSPFIAPTFETKVPRGKFEIVYTAELFGVMEKLGNKKIQVLSYLLDNKDGSNSLNMTNTEIAKETKVSRKTVVETMKILEQADLIHRKNSVVMFSANFMVKGNQMREAYLMHKFKEMDAKTIELQENAIDVEVSEQLEFTESGAIVQRAKEKP